MLREVYPPAKRKAIGIQSQEHRNPASSATDSEAVPGVARSGCAHHRHNRGPSHVHGNHASAVW